MSVGGGGGGGEEVGNWEQLGAGDEANKMGNSLAAYQDLEGGKDAVRRVVASQFGEQHSQRITQLEGGDSRQI